MAKLHLFVSTLISFILVRSLLNLLNIIFTSTSFVKASLQVYQGWLLSSLLSSSLTLYLLYSHLTTPTKVCSYFSITLHSKNHPLLPSCHLPRIFT